MLSAWIVLLMVALQPDAPWIDSYTATSKAIAEQAEQDPIFTGAEGTERTAALLVSLAWFESRFDPDAMGDHGKAFGLYQVQAGGDRGPRLLGDARAATESATWEIRRSFQACRRQPFEERLAFYASGSCSKGIPHSKHRIELAQRLLKTYPPPFHFEARQPLAVD